MSALAQTFYIDKSIVSNAEHVVLDAVDLYFKRIPKNQKNRSGITNPGVTVYLSTTKDKGVPDIDHIYETGISRKEYVEIIASADASIPTKFKFSKPLIVPTNKTYAILVLFDGDEEFDLWTCKEGEYLVKTNTITSGANAKNVGQLFNCTNLDDDSWNSVKNTDLKFTVYSCIFSANTSATTVTDTYVLPAEQAEHIVYNRYHPNTSNPDRMRIGELFFLETPVIYGIISVNSQSLVVTSSNNINFSTIFLGNTNVRTLELSVDPVLEDNTYIVLRNGANSSANVDVVKIHSVLSNTQLQLERLPIFTNNAATFSVTGVARLENFDFHYFTGRWFDYTSNTFVSYSARKTDIVKLSKSNANSTVRFVLNSNNSDPQHISYIEDYANASATIVTNGAGTITGISVTNSGYGFVTNTALSITSSNGSGANISFSTGSLLRAAESNAQIADVIVTSIPVNRTLPNAVVQYNQHVDVQFVNHFPFHVFPGYEHIVNQANTAFNLPVTPRRNSRVQDSSVNDSRVHVIPSHSLIQKKAANVSITLANGSIHTTKVKSSSLLELPLTSTNIYTAPVVSHGVVYNYSYIINNDITGETKGHGNAKARHISEKVSFAEDRNAEDLVVYSDVYKPVNTNVYAYARIHANDDQESFDDKDWTLLELRSNNATYVSSLTDENDIVELTWGIPSSPASVNTITGYATLTLSNTDITGINSAWDVDLQVNDVVKIYSELFPENFMISVVRNIANSSYITLDDSVSDPDLVGTNCKVDLVGRPANGANSEIGTPFQAFIYSPNSSIVRYYDSAMSKHDAYNTFQIKLVLTSDNIAIVPKIWDTRAVGVSA
jgi:hypothetical protein